MPQATEQLIEAALLHMARGATVTRAAALVGLGRRTLHLYLARPEVRARLDQLCAEVRRRLLDRAVAELAGTGPAS
jgi:hypothetical protein